MLLVASRMQAQAEALQDALEHDDLDRALELTDQVSPLRTAQILVSAPKENLIPFLEGMAVSAAADVIAQLPSELSLEVLQRMNSALAGKVAHRLPPEYMAELVRHLPGEQMKVFLAPLKAEFREQVEALVAYEDDRAGAVMSPRFVAVELGSTVRDVMQALKATPPEMLHTAYVYVVRPAGQLRGVVSLRDLMVQKRDTLVDDIMVTDVFAARTTDEALDAARRIRSRRLKMIPVVDDQDVLCGVINIDQAMDLLAHEVADEFVAINAGSPDESFFTPPKQAVRKRLPWMMSNIFLNLGAVYVISSFESTLVQVAILAAFLPMITDMGGNVGIQALSVSIRSMALGEARLGDVWKAVRKETVIGMINGLALGLVFSIIAFAIQGNAILGLVAGVALGVNVLVAGLVGGTMPFLIKRMGQDPAMMTGPVLTTITDITGVTIYLGLSTVFLASLMATGAA